MNTRSNEAINVDLKEIFYVLWSSRFFIIFLTSIFALLILIYSLSLQNLYKSETTAAVFSESNSSSLSQYSSIAAIAGVSLPSRGGIDKAVLIEKTITSRDFVQHLMNIDENFLPNLMAVKKYDQSNNTIIYDEEIYNASNKEWISLSANGNLIPSFLEVHKKYLNIISFSQETISKIISISVEHESPEFAYHLLQLILRELNNVIKNQDIYEAEQSINYLNDQLSSISQADVKKSINTLIEGQLEKLMLANVKEYYLLQPIDLPYIPEEKSNPPRALICIIGTIFGLLIAISFVLIRHYFHSINRIS